MLYLVTGTPGASKTLNTIKQICEDPAFAKRKIYYNNVKCLALDIDFLNSFEGYFYTYFLRTASEKDINLVRPIVSAAHHQQLLVSIDDLAFLKSRYRQYDYVENFAYWVKRLYPESRSKPLFDYLNGAKHFKYKVKISDIKRFNLHFTYFNDPHEWFKLPHGSVIFIDEIQDFFPNRPSGQEPPEYISKINKHRHFGYDILTITQNAMLLDAQARACVGKHIHYINYDGGSTVTRVEHGELMNVKSTSELKNANKTFKIKRDERFYGSYYSAEIHTHRYSMPLVLKRLIYAIPFLFVSIFVAVYFIFNISGSFNSTLYKSESDLDLTKEVQNQPAQPPIPPTLEAQNVNQTTTNCTVLSSGRVFCL